MSVEPPDHLQCPIFYVLFRDPVIISSGRTYERDAVEDLFEKAKKLKRKPVDPISREEVSGEVWTNWQSREAVETFLEENPGYDPGWGGRALAPPLGVTRMNGATVNLQQKVNELSQSAEKLKKMEGLQLVYAVFSVWSLLCLWISLWGFAPTSWASLSLLTKVIVLGGAYVGIWAVCKTVAVIYIDVLERALPLYDEDTGDNLRGFWMALVTLPVLLPCWCWRGKAFFGLEWFVGLDDSSLGGCRWYSQIFWISLWLVFLRLANEATIRILVYGEIVWRWFQQKSAQQQQ